jgi:hypothetical protein
MRYGTRYYLAPARPHPAAAFDAASLSHRRDWVQWVAAKRAETRARRVRGVVEQVLVRGAGGAGGARPGA